MESAAENKPPVFLGISVRVKWCGKSAPRWWQQQRHGKPHLEQDQIGEYLCAPRVHRTGVPRTPG